MAKVKYDVTDVEAGDRSYAQPTPGVYGIKIVEANRRDTDGKDDIECIVEVTDKGEFEGARMWSYVNFGEASRWKLREFTDALGLPAKGSLDTTKLIGKKCQAKVSSSTWEGEYRARLQRWLPLSDSVDGVDDDDDDDDTEDEPTAASNNGAGGDEDYSDWDLDELKAEAEERGIMGNISGRKTKDKLVEALEADDAGQNGGGDDEEEEASGTEDDYDEWELDELQSEIKDRSLTVSGRKTKDKLIAALRADDSEEAF